MNKLLAVMIIAVVLSGAIADDARACTDEYPIPVITPLSGPLSGMFIMGLPVSPNGDTSYDPDDQAEYDPDCHYAPGIDEWEWAVAAPGGVLNVVASGDYPEFPVNLTADGTWYIRLAVKDQEGNWSYNRPEYENRYANSSIDVWDPGAPLGSKSATCTTYSSSSLSTQTWNSFPNAGGATQITSAYVDSCEVVFNPNNESWEWQVEAGCGIFCGLRPFLVDVSSGDDPDLTTYNYCGIAYAMLWGSGVYKATFPTTTYYGSHLLVQGHEDVHYEQFEDELDIAMDNFLSNSVLGPYPVDLGDPVLASAEEVYDEYYDDVYDAILEAVLAVNGVVAGNQDYEDDARQAVENPNSLIGNAILSVAYQKQPPWPECNWDNYQ